MSDGWFTMTLSTPGVSDVWQAKDLREDDFGCVTTEGVMGGVSRKWANKRLGKKWD